MAGEWRGSWNGEKSYRYKEGGSKGTKSWRPPHAPGSEIPSVPLWEKKFCTRVGAIPWKRFCENKKFMGMYETVIQWDDSAALEAFQNAKARFYAEYNGFHCNIPPPDPDLYIDEVDQDAIVDPDLVTDLDKPPPAPTDVDNTATSGWDSFVFTDKPVPASGWDDTEDPVPSNEKTDERSSANWDAYIEQIRPSGWGNASETYRSSWDIKNDSGNAWGCSGGVWGKGLVRDKTLVCGTDNYWDNWKRNSWGTWENRNNEPNRRNGRKRDGGGRFGSRYTKPKYQVWTVLLHCMRIYSKTIKKLMQYVESSFNRLVRNLEEQEMAFIIFGKNVIGSHMQLLLPFDSVVQNHEPSGKDICDRPGGIHSAGLRIILTIGEISIYHHHDFCANDCWQL